MFNNKCIFKMIKKTSLIFSLFCLMHAHSSELSLGDYLDKADQISQSLTSSPYLTEEFKNALNLAHKKKISFPERESPLPFLRYLSRYVAMQHNKFEADYIQERQYDNMLTSVDNVYLYSAIKEDFAMPLIGFVNITLLKQFSIDFPEGSPERKKTMLFLASALHQTSSHSLISGELKQKLVLSELSFAIHHLNEMIGYKNYENIEEKKQEWMAIYWTELNGNPSHSQYINLLKAILIKEGYDQNFSNPRNVAIELLYKDPSTSSAKLPYQQKDPVELSPSPMSLRTHFAKDLSRKLLKEFQNLEESPSLLDAEQLSERDGTSDELENISLSTSQELLMAEREPQQPSFLVKRKETEGGFKEKKQRKRKKADKYPVGINHQSIRQIMSREWENKIEIDAEGICAKLQCVNNVENIKKIKSIMSYEINDERNIFFKKKEDSTVALKNFLFNLNLQKNEKVRDFFPRFMAEYSNVDISLKTFESKISIVRSLLQLHGDIDIVYFRKPSQKLTEIYNYLESNLNENISYEEYCKSKKMQKEYSINAFDKCFRIYKTLFPEAPSS